MIGKGPVWADKAEGRAGRRLSETTNLTVWVMHLSESVCLYCVCMCVCILFLALPDMTVFVLFTDWKFGKVHCFHYWGFFAQLLSIFMTTTMVEATTSGICCLDPCIVLKANLVSHVIWVLSHVKKLYKCQKALIFQSLISTMGAFRIMDVTRTDDLILICRWQNYKMSHFKTTWLVWSNHITWLGLGKYSFFG